MSTDRPFIVRSLGVLAILGSLIVAGCAGNGATFIDRDPGEISGVIFDEDGDVVREADVFIQSPRRETFSNSSGAYVLRDVPADDLVVRAELFKDGIEYYGQTLARVFENERARSANITMFRKNRTGTIRGVVEDENGFRLRGVRVTAIGGTLSSTMTITNSDGRFVLPFMGAGIDFLVSASGPEYRSDIVTVRLGIGQDLSLRLVMDQTTGIAPLGPVTGLDAVSWTSPNEATRSDRAASYEAIKRLIDPRRPSKTSTRETINGNLIEVDLYWDPVISNFLLGYGIYRGEGDSGPVSPIDFLRDPLAEFFADASDEIFENEIYSYAIDAVNTDSEEGPLSNRVTVFTLGDLELLTPDETGTIQFRWQAVPNADNYVVYLFDELPSIGVSSIWNTESNPTTGTTQNYTGPALFDGETYYYVIIGLADGTASRTISRIDTIVPN